MPRENLTFIDRLAYGLVGVAAGLAPGVAAALVTSWLQGHTAHFGLIVLAVAAAVGALVFAWPALALLVVEALVNFAAGLLNGVGGGSVVAPDRLASRWMKALFWVATAGAVAVLVYLQFRFHFR